MKRLAFRRKPRCSERAVRIWKGGYGIDPADIASFSGQLCIIAAGWPLIWIRCRLTNCAKVPARGAQGAKLNAAIVIGQDFDGPP